MMMSFHEVILLTVLLWLVLSPVYGEGKESSYAALKRKQQERKAQAQQKQQSVDQQRQERLLFEERRRRQQQEQEKIVYYDAPVFAKAVLPTLQAKDRILFFGHSNTLYAALQEEGFIPLFRQEILKVFPNMVIESIASVKEEQFVLHDTQDALQKLAIDNFRPSKVFFVVGADFLREYAPKTTDGTMSTDALNVANKETTHVLQQRVQSYFAFFARHPAVRTVVLPLLLHGERSDTSNTHDVFIEDCLAMMQKLALHYDGKITVLDELWLSLHKHWEAVNWQHLDHSVLTHDGEVLNDEGHLFLARELLNTFQIPHSLPMLQFPHAMLPSRDAVSESDAELLLRVQTQRAAQHQMLLAAKQMMSQSNADLDDLE